MPSFQACSSCRGTPITQSLCLIIVITWAFIHLGTFGIGNCSREGQGRPVVEAFLHAVLCDTLPPPYLHFSLLNLNPPPTFTNLHITSLAHLITAIYNHYNHQS
jgi:hypothetical protein